VGISTFDGQQSIIGSVILAAGSGTTPGYIWNTTYQRARMDHIWITSTATGAHVLGIYYRAGSTNYRIAGINVPAGAGDGTVPSVDVVQGVPQLVDGLQINGSSVVYIGCDVALTGGETITLTGAGSLV
jgi:hypothetical protein